MSDWLKKNKWPLAIFLAAILIRLIYLLQIKSNPAFDNPMVDELWHLNWARDILNGNLIGDKAYFRGPLYPYFLAIIYGVTGESIFFTRLLQLVMGSFSAVLVYLIGKKLLGNTIGVIAGFIFAVYGTIIFYEAMFLIPVLYIFLILLAFLYLLKSRESNRLKDWFTVGIFMGLAAIARPNILFLVPFVLLWIYFLLKSGEIKRKRLKTAGIYLIAVLIPVFAVTIRNLAVTGEFILISSQGGVNLYIGNNPDTEGLTMLMPEVRIDESLPWSEFNDATRAAAEREAGHPLTAAGESSFWTKKAISFIFNNPGKFISITIKKLIYFLDGFENSDNADIYFTRNYSSLFSVLLWKSPLLFPFGMLLPLALVGVYITWRKRRELLPLYIFIIAYIPTVVLFLVTARHRLPVIPFIIILATAGAYGIFRHFKEKKWNRLGISAVILIVSLVLVNRTYFEIGFQNESQIHFNLAIAYERDNELNKAEEEYKLALDSNPYSPTILNNLGYVQYRLKKYGDALENFQKATDSDPKFGRAYNNAALVYEARGQIEEASRFYRQAINVDPSLYQAYINLGDLYIRNQDMQNAHAVLNQAIEMAPKEPHAYFKLGALYGRVRDYEKAEEFFTKGSRLGTPQASDYINWGNIYFATERPERALEMYRQAVRQKPDFTQAYFNMAITFQRYGISPDSVRLYLNKTLGLNPNHPQARQLLQQLGG